MKRQRIPFRALAIILLAISLSACKKNSGTSAEQNISESTIKVGLFASLTGSEASFGRDSLQGTRLAMEEINSRGGIFGHKIQLIVKDNQSKAGETSIIVQELINREHICTLLGEVASGRSLEAASIAQKSGIPMISSGSTNLRVTKVGNFIFRVCFIDSFQGKVMAKFARSLGIQRVAIISDNSKDYSIGLAQNFAKDFIERDGKIVAQQSYTRGDKDFSSQLIAVKTANPEAIFLPSYYTEAPIIINQARQLGLDIPFMGGDGWDSAEFIKMGSNAVEGSYFSSHFSSDNKEPLVQNFVKNYQQKYSELPSALSALAYDSMKLLADAIRRAGNTEPAKIRDALAATKNFPGVSGTITFDENRNPMKPAVIIRVQHGKFTYLETLTP